MRVEILEQKGNKFLWIDNYLCMWDVLPEKKLQYKIATESSGDVLVAGYGLGIVQEYLMNNPNVNSVMTIEKFKEVIEANEKYDIIHGDHIIGDFYESVLHSSIKFDCIIGDIWEDIVPEQLSNYKKFKEKAWLNLKPNGKILAWGKDYYEYLIEKESK